MIHPFCRFLTGSSNHRCIKVLCHEFPLLSNKWVKNVRSKPYFLLKHKYFLSSIPLETHFFDELQQKSPPASDSVQSHPPLVEGRLVLAAEAAHHIFGLFNTIVIALYIMTVGTEGEVLTAQLDIPADN